MGKEVVIIGSGLGGLSCGVILAKNGYRVTVLEKSMQAGGCLQCFERRGVKFETGMHFIGSADKGQTLNKLLRYLEVDHVPLSRLDPEGYDVISFGGKHYRIANGREAFIRELAKDFPEERAALEAYCDLIERIAEASSLHSLRHAESDSAINTEYQMRSINEVIGGIIHNPELRNVIVGNLPLYAAELDRTPFATHAFIMDFYNQSAFRVVGGSENFTKAMVEVIERYGGRVLTGQEAQRIVCDETHATGVLTAGGRLFTADVVISSAHPCRTLEMLDTKLIRPAFRKRIQGIRNTAAGFTVYLQLKKGAVPYMNHNFYRYRYGTPWGCENYTQETWPKGYLYMHLCHEQEPRHAEAAVVLSYMSMEEVKQWAGTTVGRRGADYKAFKQRKAERLIDVLCEDFPELRGKIEHFYTSSPLTYRDYTGTQDGSMYGVAKDITEATSSRVPHKTKVPNLLLTGQNVNSHGMLGTLVGTVVTCSELLTAERIYQQIIKANNDDRTLTKGIDNTDCKR